MRLRLPSGREVDVDNVTVDYPAWDGDDPPELKHTWSSKPKVAWLGTRTCPELFLLRMLEQKGWEGVWVNAYGRHLRSEWFPAPKVDSLASAGAPSTVVDTFADIENCVGGRKGCWDVVAWRPNGAICFVESKVGTDQIRDSQLRWLECALDHGLALDAFAIAEGRTLPGDANLGAGPKKST